MHRLPLYIAVHEAGHAVASWHVQQLLGRHWCQFERVFIRTPEEVAAGPYVDPKGRNIQCEGLLEGPSRYHAGLLDPRSQTPEIQALVRQNMKADVITTLAGPIAEARFRKCSLASVFLEGGKEDYDDANRCLSDFEHDANHSNAFDELERCTRAIVRQRWGAIMALANKLLVRRSLSGAEAVAVIELAVAP